MSNRTRRGVLGMARRMGGWAAGAAALPMGACTVGADGGSSAPKQAQPVTLDFEHRWDGAAREPIVQEQIRKFRDNHPHVTVNVVMYHQAGETTTQQAARFMAAIAAGTPPDVFMIHAFDAVNLAERNALTFLDSYLKKDKIKLEEIWFPAAIPMMQFKGNTFALPQTAAGDSPYFFYNKGMLQAAGVDAKDLGTWQGLLTAARTLTRTSGDDLTQVGFPYPGGNFPTWIVVNAGEILSKDGRKPAFNTAPVREALTHVTDATKATVGTPEKLNAFVSQYKLNPRGGTDSAFAAQKLAMWLSGPWVWQETPKFGPDVQLGASRMPVNRNSPQSKATTLADSVWTWAMGAGIKHPDEAWLLEKWMSYDDGHKGLMIGMGRATMVKRVVQDKAFFDQNPGWNIVLETMAAATPLPPTRGWDKITPIVNRLPQDVLSGKYGVADALTQAEREAQAALDEAYR